MLNVIANSGNPSYFETRALEFIAEAGFDRIENSADTYEQKIIRAIQMLVIAVIKVQMGEK